jgi:hypothetical protein
MNSAAVIIATTGAPEVRTAIESVLAQSHPRIRPCIVIDGLAFKARFDETMRGLALDASFVTLLNENVGGDGFYGHRIYAAFTHLVNADYVLYLDQDNWFDADHVASAIDTIERKGVDWCYSLRKICDRTGSFLLNDDCESLGKWTGWKDAPLIDTSTYCLRRSIAVQIAGCWHGGWGQDRVVFAALRQHFPRFECTGRYTVNYRLDGNEGSVTKEFFEQGNRRMRERYQGALPWQALASLR